MGQVLRNSENQELARWQDLSLCSLSLYLCFFLWVALFLLTPDDFPFLGGHHGLWQHLNFIYYNFVREKTDSTPECQIKKFQGLTGFSQSTQPDNHLWPVNGVTWDQLVLGPTRLFAEVGMFLEKVSLWAGQIPPRSVSYNTQGAWFEPGCGPTVFLQLLLETDQDLGACSRCIS